MKVRTLQTVSRDGKRHPAGTEIDLPTATAEHLLALNPPAVARLTPVAPSAPSVFDASASTKTLVPQIKASTDTTTLAALRQAELNRPDGARATVIAAIDARLEALAAAAEEDEGSDEGDE
jgi:hypothetical protein